ncbi:MULTISPECIES: hypothetical protein [Pseudomonas syringae group]|uniref:Uncharacterized protein n=2 Tax=Pseudomonas syringae group TaxID=136849 RepID=A0AB35R7H9_PSEA0|nr:MULTISPECIES: hypothetical protein [Pseudomonas syringae group]KWS51091.1 hypothetical protein AL056_12865 [Pseudomonas amygdali pv. morsprunorum]KWS58724.1 hypothetical protein AL054_11780 [Pseudomonas amygdali pv. morsprunorum]MBI6732885.1 hypothetical protein [Pseudomonas amygdali]MBI6814982.1 hypothetical protein [Pseudomonas amygdali]MDT3226758.1 hypothetical protein [Pseudomonas amygdali pv. morsprunorum]
MPQDDAQQKPKFKWIKRLGAWALVPGLGVPATKFVESYYDVSFFSPAISGLLSWMGSVGSWFARDVSLPFWVVIILLILILLLLVPVLALVYARYEKVEPPSGSPLTDDQTLVFVVVGNAIQAGCQFGFDEVLRNSGLSRIATQNALDHLTRVGLVRPVRGSYGFQYADLTPRGREHFLELESLGEG